MTCKLSRWKQFEFKQSKIHNLNEYIYVAGISGQASIHLKQYLSSLFSLSSRRVSRYYMLDARVRCLAHVGGAELEDHGGAQETQETDPGNIIQFF